MPIRWGAVGGDEFVVLLTHVEEDQDAVLVAEKICKALGQPFDLDGRSLLIGSSVGRPCTPNMAVTN